MPTVYTSTIRYAGPDRLDITVKGQDPVGRVFAPNWDLVMGHKSGKYSDDDYTIRYHTMMVESYGKNFQIWQELLTRETVVLVCYCAPGKFCHRRLLYQYLVELGMTPGGEI